MGGKRDRKCHIVGEDKGEVPGKRRQRPNLPAVPNRWKEEKLKKKSWRVMSSKELGFAADVRYLLRTDPTFCERGRTSGGGGELGKLIGEALSNCRLQLASQEMAQGVKSDLRAKESREGRGI